MIDLSGSSTDTKQPERADEALLAEKTYLDGLFELAPDAVVLTTLRSPRVLRINREFTRIFGYTSEEAVGSSLRDLIMPDGLESLTLAEDSELLAGRKVEREDIRRRKNGSRFHAHITGKRIQLSNEEDAAYLIFRDVSERKVAEALLSGEKRLLEVVAAGGPLSTTLDALCRLAQEVDPNSLVSILLVDRQGKHLHHGAGPSLPPTYVQAINGAPVGLGVGPCAAAAHLGEQMISLDMSADYRWSDEMRALTLTHGLRTCWSTPIKSSQGRVLGTFALYPREPADPTPEQRSTIEQLTHLASIAIERAQSMDALRQSEERYALAMEAAAGGHMDWNLATGEFYISPRMLAMVGHAPEATFVDRADWVRRFPFHPEDRPRWEAAIAAHFAGREAKFRGDFRIVVNGETRWLAFNFIATRDASGNVIRWTGSIADIDDAKRDIAAVLDAIPGLVAILTPAGEVDAVNSELAAYCGQPLEAMRQWGTNGTVHADDLPRVATLFMQAISMGEPYDFEARIRRFDGAYRWNQVRGLPFRDSSGRIVRWYVLLSDIDASKRAEEALRLSEERYALAMRASGEGHWDWKIESDEFYASPRYLEIAGLPADMKYSRRQDIVPLLPFHPDDRARYEAAVAAHFAGETPRLDIVIRLVPNGELRWLHVIGMCLRDADSKPVRWAGSVSNITERKLAEEALKLSEQALRESEKRYERAMVAAEAGFWDWDVAADDFYVSPRLLEMSGSPAGTRFAGRADFMARGRFHPDDRIKWESAVKELFASGGTRLAMEIRSIHGAETRWVSLNGLCVRDADGKVLRWTGSATDVTARKRAEEALRLSEERYALAMEASDEGHFDWNVKTDEIFASEHLQQLLGLLAHTEPRTRGELMTALIPFHPDDRERINEMTRDVLAGAARHHEFEYRLLRGQSRELRWIHARWKIFRDADGVAQRIIGVVSDITERKRVEEALREQTERLQLGQAAMRMIIMDWNIAEDVLTWSDSPEWLRGPMPASGRYPLFKDQVHSEDRDRFLASRLRALETLEVQTTEFRLVRTDCEVIWVLERKHALGDTGGKPVRMLSAMFDITDRRRAEEALRRSEAALRLSEERYSLAAAGSNDGIWDWDLFTNKMFVSERAQRIFGLEPGVTERLREEWHAMIEFHPVDHEAQRRMVDEYLSGERSGNEGEWRVRGKDGAYRWIRIRSICLRDAAGKPIRMAGSVSDIDAQKKAEEALRQSEERYTLAVDGASQGIFDWDLPNDQVFHSHRAQEFLGLKPGKSWRARREWAAMIRYDPEDLSRMRTGIRRHLNGETPTCDIEYRVVPQEGDVRWLRQRGVLLRDASGKAYRMAGSIEDVTQRKVAAEALRESEARFRGLTALWSDWYWRQDEHLRFTYSSAGGNWPDGSARSSSIGMTRWEIPGIVPLSSSWDEHRALLAARKPFRDFEYRRPAGDGTVRYVSSSGTPIFDDKGEFRGYQGVARDITDSKAAEEKLRSRQEMVKLAQKAAGAVAFEWRAHAEKGKNRWSPDLEAMYGIPPGSYDGTEASLKKLIHPDDWAMVRAAIKSSLKSGDLDAEYRVIHPDGAIRWLQSKGRTLFDSEGKAERIVGFMFDVTDRRVAEGELRRMEQQLRQAQRLEALGTLAGGIAHDFNNLLGAILGYGEMALRDARAGSRLRRDIQNIMIAGERGHALVERILAFSRSGLGERVAVHVEEVVRETLALFAAKLPRHIVIESRLHAGSAAVMGDPTQIHQVLMNLLTNAVHAMSSGGTLRVALDRLHLSAPRVMTTGALGVRDYIALDVSDSGGGIPPEIFEKIFDPFFTTKEVGVGTGLGLSLVHGIVTGLGGAIDVATAIGKGSAFKVYLPISGDVAVQRKPRRRVEHKTGWTGSGRVMVIDDEEALVKLVSETLTELGCSAVGFTSSTKALEAFLADPDEFDVVITDESMPGMSGSELIRKMRALRATLPILLVSGYLSTPVVLRARKAGATEVLKKPLRAHQLRITLERVLLATSSNRNELASSKHPIGSAKPRRRVSAS